MYRNLNKYPLIVIFSLFIVLSGVIHAQQYSFEIIMDSDYDEAPTLFKLNDDGCFVGLVRKAPPTDSIYVYDTYLYKISLQGDTLSIKYAKEDTVSVFFYIDKLTTEPKGYLLTGWGHKKGEDPHHPFTIMRRITDDLDLVWEKTFKFNNYYFGSYKSSAMELINGDILYACSPHLNINMFILKLSAEGDSLNFVTYSGSDAGEVWGLTYSPDSTAIWLHNWLAHYQGQGSYVSSCIVLNQKLEQIGVKHYPEFLFPPFNALLYNDSILLTGGSDRVPNPKTGDVEHLINAYLLDTAFNVIHEVHLTHPDTNSRAAEVQGIDFYYPGCIYLGGNHNLQGMTGHEPSWFYIAKLNDTLGLEYEKYIGGDDYYWLYSVTAASDGGVLLAGTRNDYTATYFQRDGYILKIDSLGFVQTPENIHFTISEAVVYPNPGNEIINIRTALKSCIFNLFDTFGRQILKKPMPDRITTVKTNTLSKGTYYYSVTDNNKTIISGTWIKN